ncbi:MAG: hypothetical protein MUP11_11115, partial [Anaerolineales bacterium]|nr:hypothetical protein [Anaerolineales bacterium]
MNQNLKMKWVIWNEIFRILALPYIRLLFFVNRVPWKRNWRVLGAPIIQPYTGSKITIGDNLIMRSWVTSNPVAPNHPVFLSTRTDKAEILIGNDFGITGGSIIAAERVKIGNRVLIGGNCLITDTDFHPLEPGKRMEHDKGITAEPIFIEDDVFIGTSAIILKGVK